MAKKRLTKSEYVAVLAKKSGLEKKQVTALLTAIKLDGLIDNAIAWCARRIHEQIAV